MRHHRTLKVTLLFSQHRPTSKEIAIRDWVFWWSDYMNAVRCLCCACSIALLDACACDTCRTRTERGRASYYGHDMNGCKTANGETYHADAYTAAQSAAWTSTPDQAVSRHASHAWERDILARYFRPDPDDQ